MSIRTSIRLIVVALFLAGASFAQARDLFVRAGSSGDGSQKNPFGDPWEALEKCEAGDAIHVAQGRYTGKLQAGQWTIPYDNIQLLGGYSADWSQRNPWTFRSELVYDRNSKNFPKDARILGNGKNLVIDGLVLDMSEQNEYAPDDHGRTPRSLDSGKEAVYLWHPSTVRNCVFLNTGREAIICRNGSTIENNLFVNVVDSAVKVQTLPQADPASKVPATIRNNTFAWSWCEKAPGKGRYSGAGVSMGGNAAITQNIFAHCDNNAIYCTINPERSSISGNVFSMNLWSNFKMFIEGRDVVVDDKTMDLFEECGLKASDGNKVASPGLPLDPEWMDGAAKRTAAVRGKVEMDDWNKLRQSMGLNLVGSGGKPATGLAPAYPLDMAMALMTPKNDAIKAGARLIKLEPKFSGEVASGPAKSYQKAELISWARQPEQVDGKPLEMTVAVSNVANVSSIPATYKQDDHEGIFLHDADGNERVTGFYRKGSTVNRSVSDAAGQYSGSGKATRLYVVRGIAYAQKNIPKAAFYIESIEPFTAKAATASRAKGRDWFVRAGSSGGDGTREKPFKDPYQALEKCEAGDTIHVTGGEYVGKLRAGVWHVDAPNIALLGGYDGDFKERDPWQNPSLLYCPADFKGSRGGYTFQGGEDHTGCILDGFVFDKRTNNVYAANGDLQVSESDKVEHLWFAKPACVIRNCLFINGAGPCVRVANGQTLENNIFMNHNVKTIGVTSGHTTEPIVIRNNTILFTWDIRFGQGMGRNGEGIVLETDVRAIVENNVIEFSDNDAIRLNANPKDVELAGNVFAHNLFSIVFQTQGPTFVDDKMLPQLKDLGWKRLENNQVMIPNLPIDQKWFETYLNRTAYVPGKVKMDDWNQLREVMGQPLIATGGSAGSGYAPAYDRAKALALVPRNEQCKAGARPVKLEVKFEGVAPKATEKREYAQTSWDVAKNAGDWQKLDGKRVQMKVVITRADNQWMLDDVKKEDFAIFMVSGPEGTDSGGLPMRLYVPRGTKVERAFNQAKGYSSGRPDETHLVKGIARGNRQMVVEGVEKAD